MIRVTKEEIYKGKQRLYLYQTNVLDAKESAIFKSLLHADVDEFHTLAYDHPGDAYVVAKLHLNNVQAFEVIGIY